jgi:hypothetical protein
MKTSNIVSENLRQAETGLVWVEVLSGAQGSFTVTDAQTFRVRATGATTVTIDGLLAMTMSTGEIVIFNAGHGNPDLYSPYITITIAGANAFVQVAQEVNRKKLQPNPLNNLDNLDYVTPND